ncbi:MAG TPA: gliding motility protein GldC [Calditrichia bacterium]|nr:gliding motility protein GldC [Calditrichota bacterium]HQV32411.1 gliding motility protein GldC [Calditrichia bacterium]
MSQKKEIKFTIELDDRNMPQKIQWETSDDGEGPQECASLMIYMWDPRAQNSMSIDLWTRHMLVDHMNIHFFHKLMKMADTYGRATGNQEGAAKIREFAKDFGIQAKGFRDQQAKGGQ